MRPKLVACRQARRHPGLDYRKVVRRRFPNSSLGLRPQWKAREAVIAAQAASSGVERSAGARVVGRLQKLVTSTFFVAPRRAARRTEARRSSRAGWSSLGKRGQRPAPCEKGAEQARANVKGNASKLHSAARSSRDPVEGVSDRGGRRPNPAAAIWVLARRKAASHDARERRESAGRGTTGACKQRAWEVELPRQRRPSDRGRQRSRHPVGLPQPKGAGGRRPTRARPERRLPCRAG